MRAALARLRTAAWLGWQVESNWADPVLFSIYIVARPLATALILVVMYGVVRGRASHAAAFTGFYLANAFHAYANTVLVGMGRAVFDEREEYETLKYVYASPVGMLTYLLGRSSVKFALASISVLVVMGLGWFALGVHWNWSHVQWVPLLAALVLGLVATAFLGFLLAGASLVMVSSAITVLEGVALSLYLLCGVIFPIDLLPRALQWVALAIPLTWWYEALRRFLLGRGSSALLSRLSGGQLLAMLALVTVVFSLVSRWGYGVFEHRARQRGTLDQTTLF